MTLQLQPTPTSCGQTAVAMIVGVPVAEVLARTKVVTRRHRGTRDPHGTTMAEVVRLLKPYGVTLGRRIQREPLPATGTCLLRIARSNRAHWHWAVLCNGTVFNPSGESVDPNARVSWYEVEKVL